MTTITADKSLCTFRDVDMPFHLEMNFLYSCTSICRVVDGPIVIHIFLNPGRPVAGMMRTIWIFVIIRRPVVHQIPGCISNVDLHLLVAGSNK